MNSKIYKLAVLFFLVTIASVYYSCKKEDKKDDTTPVATTIETSDVEDNNVAESEAENMDDFVEEETTNNTEIGARFAAGCREIDTTYSAKTTYSCVSQIRFIRKCDGDSVKSRELRFYFDSTVVCKDKRFRKGWIEVTFDGNHKLPGTSMTIQTHDYYVKLKNDNVWVRVNLVKTIKVVDFWVKVAQGERYRKVKVTVNSARIRMNATDSISWSTTRTKEIKWTGLLAQQIPVRTASHWGTVSGTDRKGNAYSITVDSMNAVVRKSDCEYKLISGIMNFTKTGKETRILDFGSDSTGAQTKTCDPWVKISVGSNSKVVKMK